MLLRRLGDGVTLCKLLVILQAMRQCKLIACRKRGEAMMISVLPVQQKVDVFTAPIIQEIEQLERGGRNDVK